MGLNWAAAERLSIISSPVCVSNLSSRGGDLRQDPYRRPRPRTLGIAVAGTRYESSKHSEAMESHSMGSIEIPSPSVIHYLLDL